MTDPSPNGLGRRVAIAGSSPRKGFLGDVNVFTPAAWPDSQELEREQGLELVAGCLAERLSADNVLISVPGDEGRPSAVRAGAGLGGSLWDEEQLVRRPLQSEDTLVERFLERKGPGDLACVVAAPIRMPHGVAGAACAGFRTPPPLSSSTLSWLVESHAALAARRA